MKGVVRNFAYGGWPATAIMRNYVGDATDACLRPMRTHGVKQHGLGCYQPGRIQLVTLLARPRDHTA
jgi:hypothetical protein